MRLFVEKFDVDVDEVTWLGLGDGFAQTPLDLVLEHEGGACLDVCKTLRELGGTDTGVQEGWHRYLRREGLQVIGELQGKYWAEDYGFSHTGNWQFPFWWHEGVSGCETTESFMRR